MKSIDSKKPSLFSEETLNSLEMTEILGGGGLDGNFICPTYTGCVKTGCSTDSVICTTQKDSVCTVAKDSMCTTLPIKTSCITFPIYEG